MTNVHFRKIDDTEFLSIEAEWSRLLNDSAADPLFMSWIWLKTWWEIFSNVPGDSVVILAGYANDELVAIAPLYLSNQRAKYFSVKRLQFLGSRWRDRKNIRSEYIDFICRHDCEQEVLGALIDYIYRELEWDEFVVCNHPDDSVSTILIEEKAAQYNSFVRTLEHGTTYSIEMAGDEFSEYLKQLSQKTRLKIYNQRKKLIQKGEVALKNPDAVYDETILGQLNQFHQKRWHKNLFEDKRFQFNSKIIMEAVARGWFDGSVLQVDGKTVSVLYDFKVNDVKYGFQLGFDQDFDKRISVAQLHFGYAIEKAFKEKLTRYDFLRGMDKSKKSYKGGVAQPYRNTATIQIVRNRPLKFLYWLHEKYSARKHKQADYLRTEDA